MLNKRLNFIQSNEFWGEMQVFFALQLKHACLKLEDFLWMWVLFSPPNWLYKRNSHLNFYSTFHKVTDRKMLQLIAQLESLIKKTSFTSFVRKVRLQFNQQTHYLLLEVVLLQRCISLIRTKWHSPQSPPQDTPKKKKKKKRKEERVLVGALIFRTLCTSMMSKLTPCVLIITLVKMTNNYQRLYTKMNFRLSSYIFLGRQLQRYWILSRPL